MANFPVPLPHINITPPQPTPMVAQPVAPDADQYRAALYDARRELMRARDAALPFNFILGGFAPTLASGVLSLSPGVAQLRIPTTGWTGTYPPSGTTLYAPTESPSNILPGATADGAYRAERRTVTTMSAGDGTTGPANGDSIVCLTYSEGALDRIAPTYALTSGFTLDDHSVPIAWVRVVSGVITMVRDCRPMPPWRPRYAQRIYDPFLHLVDPLASSLGESKVLIPVDVGSFWLTATQGVVLTVSVMFESQSILNAQEAIAMTFVVSRGDPGDSFLAPHYWYGNATASIMPTWRASFPNAGRSWFSMMHLFLPRVFTASQPEEVSQAVPGVFHFNGVFVTKLDPKRDDTSIATNLPLLGARFAYLKAELVSVREADLTAKLNPGMLGGSTPTFPWWSDESFPSLPKQIEV